MKRLLSSTLGVAALWATLACCPTVALADERSATMTAFTIEQAVDCITTLAVLHNGGYERDPLAVPFTKSAFAEIGAAAAINLVARRLPIHIMKTVVYVYPVILFGNVQALAGSGPGPGIVQPAFAAGVPIRHRR